MILKSYTRGTSSFGQLADYITRRDAVMKKDGAPYILRHNLLGRTKDDNVQEFLDNEKCRLSHRKGEIKLYHDIISYRAGDKEILTPEVLDKIARRYVDLRSDKALYFGAAHWDKNHVHLHLMISATEAYTGRPIRMSKKEFQDCKRELQRYEVELGLTHSQVEHGRGTRGRTDREHNLVVRSGKGSRKGEIRALLEQSFANATSRTAFLENLKESGLKVYERGGKPAGIDDNRHYRFGTLDFGEEKMKELDIRERRTSELSGIRGEPSIDADRKPDILNEEKELDGELKDEHERSQDPEREGR